MKKKVFLLIMIMCSLTLVAGCANEKTNSQSNSTKSNEKTTVKNKVVVDGDTVTIDGAKVKDMDVMALSNIFNFSIIFDNSNNDAVKFDCSKVIIKKGDKKMTIKYPDVKEITANERYTQWGLPMANTDGLKVGDTVEVYYGNTKLGETKVLDS